jgi:hypothetical protein
LGGGDGAVGQEQGLGQAPGRPLRRSLAEPEGRFVAGSQHNDPRGEGRSGVAEGHGEWRGRHASTIYSAACSPRPP